MLVNSPWEPGGRKRKVEEFPLSKPSRREQVKVFKKGRGRSRYGGEGKFSGGFVGGVPWGFAGIHGGGEGLKKMRMMKEGRWRCDRNYGDGGGVAGNYGDGDWYGGKSSIVILIGEGENKESDYWKKVLELLMNQKNCPVEASQATNGMFVIYLKHGGIDGMYMVDKLGLWRNIPEETWVEIHDVSHDVMAMGPNNSACGGMSWSEVGHGYILSLSFLKLNIFPCAEVLRDGPAHSYSSPISLKTTYILTPFHSNLSHSTPKLLSTHIFNPSDFLIKIGLMDQILIDEATYFPNPFRPLVHPIHLSYDSQFLHFLQSSPPNQPLSTTDVTLPIFTNSLQTLGQNQPLNHGCTFTRPDHVHVTTHLEDKVDVWAAGSGKYGRHNLKPVYVPQLDFNMGDSMDYWSKSGRPLLHWGSFIGTYTSFFECFDIGSETMCIVADDHLCTGLGNGGGGLELKAILQLELDYYARVIFDQGTFRSFLFIANVVEILESSLIQSHGLGKLQFQSWPVNVPLDRRRVEQELERGTMTRWLHSCKTSRSFRVFRKSSLKMHQLTEVDTLYINKNYQYLAKGSRVKHVNGHKDTKFLLMENKGLLPEVKKPEAIRPVALFQRQLPAKGEDNRMIEQYTGKGIPRSTYTTAQHVIQACYIHGGILFPSTAEVRADFYPP